MAKTLAFAPGATRADIPDDDRLEAYWRTYYSSIFNPARLKIGAMTSEMPQANIGSNLPEAAAIPDLIRTAGGAHRHKWSKKPSFSHRQTRPSKPSPARERVG